MLQRLGESESRASGDRDEAGRDGAGAEPPPPGFANLRGLPEFREFLAASEKLKEFDPFLLEQREQRLTFWINMYNVTALRCAVPAAENLPEAENTPGAEKNFSRRGSCNIGGATYSLDDIEYGILRNNARRPYRPWRHFRFWDRRRRLAPQPPEPRVCFALARPETRRLPRFFEAGALDGQLYQAAVDFLKQGGVVIDRDGQSIRLAPLLRECSADFGGDQGVIRFVAAHLEPSADAAFFYSQAGRVDIKFQK